MKKLILLISSIFFFSFITTMVNGQAGGCPPCPERFVLTDSGCTNINVFKNGNGYLATDSIRACMGSTFTYHLSAIANGGCNYPGIIYTYTVSNGTLISSSGSSFTIQWGNTSPAGVTVNFVIPGPGPGSNIHCAGSFTILALLTSNPVAAFSISPNPACFNNPTTINFNSNASMNAVNYFWDFGDGFQATGPNPTHNYTLPGTYVITLIVTSPNAPAGGGGTGPGQPLPCPECVDSVKHTLVINNLPGPPIECVATVCAGEEATYCTTPLGCATYTWTVVGGTITSGQGTACIQVTWGTGNPQGSITLVITGCPNYCAQGTTVNVPIIPAATTITGDSVVCVNSNATYSLPVWPGTTYFWTLSGGGTIIGNNTNTPSININWTTPGNYVVTCNYYDSAKGCGGVGIRTVTVLPSGKITGPNKLCAGSTITLTAKDQFNNPIVATWTGPGAISFPGGNLGSSVTVTSNIPGVYTVIATPAPGIVCTPPTYTITVLAKPILNPIVGADSICPGKIYVYSISSNTVAPFVWTITNGTASYLSANNDSAQITWALTGPYSISITQTSVNGCVSLPQTLTVAAFPDPVITGPTNVCADDSVSYTISNMGNNHPFVWSISPANYGTILSGQGTNTVTIKWHGSINPGSNTVYLHLSLCKDDSIAVTINKPTPPVITSAGSLCGGGITLSVTGTGTFSWTCAEHVYSSNSATATGITLPGHYTVCIANYNGNGCTVCATYFVPDIGRPVATISASNVLNYCLPNLPNMNLVAASAAGYSYQWHLVTVGVVGTNSPTLPINTLTTAGSYTYYCIVSLNGCSDTSNFITINITTCTGNPGGPGCTGAIDVGNITGCNPFTVAPVATAPAGGVVVGGTTTISYIGYPATNGNTTMIFDSVGYKQITVCADISLPGPGGGTTRCCKDTVVLVTVAAKFLANDSCGKIKLTDLSTVVFPAVINTYSWSVGAFPGNTPVPPVVASFNNPAIANPLLTVTVTGQYIVTLTITSGSCTVSFMDTLSVSVPDASFSVGPSCVGTPVILNSPFTYQSYLWDFGDAATSYTQNTTHAYATVNTFNITHTVTDLNGCTNTVIKPITINPRPTCNITYTGPLNFCAGDSIVLNACPGLTNYQWYNNATAIPLATNQTYTAIQTGNYSFTASNPNSCIVASDTVSVNVTPAPNAVITVSGSYCLSGTFNIGVQSCNTCTFVWLDNNVIDPNFNTNQGTFIITAGMIGVHTYTVIVTDPATGCSATSNVTVTFFNNPTVTISVAPNAPVLCSNNLYILTATTTAASPAWAWTYNFGNIVLSATNTLTVSAGGTYIVNVTDGITGCSASAFKVVNPSPDLRLFPMGCDTLCDTAHVYLPLGSLNGNIGNYSITWYNNTFPIPTYTNVIGTGPSLNLNSLPLGSYDIAVIVINLITGCTDTSNNYSITIKHCGKCSCVGSSWDSLYFHHNGQGDNGLVGKIAGVIKENIFKKDKAQQNNVIIPPVDTAFVCGQNLGQLSCYSPITIFAKYKCNPGSCDSSVSYVLTGPVNLVGVMPLNTAGLPAGNYVLTMTGKCGDSICKTCTIPFSIVCIPVQPPSCTCVNSSWDSLYFHHGIVGGGGNGGGDGGLMKKAAGIVTQNVVTPPVDTTIFCGQNIGQFDCNDPISIFAKYKCNPASCDTAVKYVLTGPINLIGVMPLTVYGFPSGNYVLTITGKCGDSVCNVCIIRFSILCNPTPPPCTCVNSNWDSLHFHHANVNGVVNGLARISKTLSQNNVITPPVDSAFVCGQNLGQFNCNDPISIFAKYKCSSANCDSAVKYILTGPVTVTGIMPFNTGGLPAGNYVLIITGKCGDSVCKVCDIPFSIRCDTVCSCTNSNWDSLHFHHAPHDGVAYLKGRLENVIITPPVDTSFICGQNIGQFSCNDPISIFATYKCNPASCDSSVKYVLTGPVTMTGIMPFTTAGLPAGNYVLTMTGKCGDSVCKICNVLFTNICIPTPPSCSCNNSSWDSLYFHHAAHLGGGGENGLAERAAGIVTHDNAIIPVVPVDTAIICGRPLGTFSCADPISIFAKYKCNPASCDSAVKYVLTGPVTLTGIMPFSTYGLPAGNYVLILTAKCGDSICKVCDIPFIIKCDTTHVNCCLNSHWAEGPFWINKGNNSTTLINCNVSSFLINTANKNCFVPTIVKGTFTCATGCPSATVYQLYDSVTNILLNTSNDSLLIAGALASGSYYVKIMAYCGGVLCQTCNFKFKKICACDCDTTKVIQISVTTNNVVKKYNCGANIGLVYCTNNVVLNATYSCSPTSCPPLIGYTLTGPFGVTTGNLPLVLNTLTQGSYSILLTANCNGKFCKQCYATFTIKCDSVPPPPCCPYNIQVAVNNTTYSLTPSGNATIFNPLFTISGLTGIQLSEVKAEVLSYNISSNYNNECLGCKTLPFTWASINAASNMGPVPPQINVFGSTVPNFVPTGNAVYQNPREVTWGNGSLFTVVSPTSISFLLPPPPLIECCEFSGNICVKFTFKDSKCRVCEEITCFNFTINNGNIFKFCSPKIAMK